MSTPIPNIQETGNLEITFTHIPTQRKVGFTAFLETFTDTFNAEWSSEKVFGRLDPVAQYKGTDRKISCAFNIPSANVEECAFNHIKITSLLNMMYPTWQRTGSQMTGIFTISSAPLLLVRFSNLIKSSSSNLGLLGYIPSLKYEPDMNSPIFTIPKGLFKGAKSTYPNIVEKGTIEGIRDTVIGFQTLKMSFDLNVLHTHMPGYEFDETSKQTAPYEKYPHGHDILNPNWR